MDQVGAILRALVRDGRWRRSLALVVLFALGCAGLSWWQFARREEAATANRQVAANWDAAPRPLTEVLPGRAWRPQAEWRPVVVRGRYLPDEQLLVRNRPLNGAPGFEVLVPLRLDDGSTFVVDRGWVPIGTNQDKPDSVPAPPEGAVTVVARLRPSEAARGGGTPPPGEVQSIDLGRIGERLGARTWTGAYGLLRSETPPAGTTPAAKPRPSLDEGMHLSYALQWILFAAVGFGLLGWSIRRDLRDAGDEAVLAADERGERRRAHRAPSDESAEDALLDR